MRGPAGGQPEQTAGGLRGLPPGTTQEADMGLVTPVTPVPVGQLGRVHFVGIGGAGMSGIARILLARGVAVSGSDRAASEQLDELAALGAVVHVGHAEANVTGADTVVTTPSASGTTTSRSWRPGSARSGSYPGPPRWPRS